MVNNRRILRRQQQQQQQNNNNKDDDIIDLTCESDEEMPLQDVWARIKIR